MSRLMLRSRLEALGIDPGQLPQVEPCASHSEEEYGPVEMSFNLVSDKWTVWCGCGLGSDEHLTLVGAIRHWNALQNGEDVPLGVEAADPSVSRGGAD